jgi:murein DD-endopeptidase MepM/ murein hydrolase activator NlpD
VPSLLGRWLVAVTVAAALAGCASLPTSGSVSLGRSVPAAGAVDNPNVRAIPSGPFPGLAPAGLVTGFLDALVDSDSNYAIARSFLVPGADWNATADITLYDENSLIVTYAGASRVEITLTRVGVIDGRGSYRVAPAELHQQFTVVRRAGEWRISHLPAGVLLSTSDARQSLQAASIYEFNRAQTQLVPIPILVPPNPPGLATTLVRALLAGPGHEMAPAVVSAIPKGTELVGNVPIDRQGVAEVNLTGSVQQASIGSLQRLSAQVLWTLRQVPSVVAVRLLDNGAPLTNDVVPSVQSIGSLAQFDPDPPAAIAGAVFAGPHGVVGHGRSVPLAFAHRSFDSPIVSSDGATVAALRTRRRTTLDLGSSAGPLRPRLTARTLSSPAFDPAGDVLVVKGSDRSRIVEVPPVGAVRRVLVPDALSEQGIGELAVSRDGSRVAMTVGPVGARSLVVAALSTAHGALQINHAAMVLSSAHDVRGAAWAGADQVMTTGRVSGRRAVIQTGVDGYQPHPLTAAGLPGEPVQVAAAPGQPVLAVAGGEIWALVNHRWRSVSPGRDPSYAE